MTTIVVTNATDLANGQAQDAASLLQDDGGDGISLREALLAASGTAGPVTITFAPHLAGQAIQLAAELPAILRAGISVLGLVDEEGAPAITIDCNSTGLLPTRTYWYLHGSDAKVENLAFIGLQDRQCALFVTPTAASPVLERVAIANCTFAPAPGHEAYGVRVGIDVAPRPGEPEIREGQVVRGVSVTGCTFTDLGGDATSMHVQGSGIECLIEDVLVDGCTFVRCTYPVELVLYEEQGTHINRTVIRDSLFVDDFQPISLVGGRDAAGGTISGTSIIGNSIFRSLSPAIHLSAIENAAGTQFLDTVIANNLIVNGETGGGIAVTAGSGTQASGNSTEGVLITNNTLVRPTSGGNITILNSWDGASGNTVSGVTIQNTIVTGEGDSFQLDAGVANVFNCLIAPHFLNRSIAEFGGVNGTIVGDPSFVDAANGDYRLAGGSLGIDAGRAIDAPATDASGFTRVDDLDRAGPSWVDIGAWEFRGDEGDDRLDFGDGLQEVALAGARAGYTVVRTEGVVHATGPSGEDVFDGLERLRFADAGIAWDLDEGRSANMTVRVITAAFGSESVATHPAWVGYGLGLFDAGGSMQETCAFVAQLLSLDNRTFVARVYENVMGHPASEAEIDMYSGLLVEAGESFHRASCWPLLPRPPTRQCRRHWRHSRTSASCTPDEPRSPGTMRSCPNPTIPAIGA